MVGLSVVLEMSKNLSRDSGRVISPKPPQVLNKTAVMITTSAADISGFRRGSSYSDPGFLEHCSLCKKRLLYGKDIYMYKGGTFCSEECRSRQIFMDEEERLRRKKNCSLDAVKTTPSASPSSPTSSPAPDTSGYSRRRRGARNRAGGFAY